MKKLMIALFVMMTAVGANAQKLGVWYGLGLPCTSADQSESYLSPLNFGVDYTHQINAFDITGGISLRQKGSSYSNVDDSWKPLQVQFDITGAYNFLNQENLKVNVFTGPYLGLVASKDKDFWGGADVVKETVFGWQAGVGAVYNNITLKVGYEWGLTKAHPVGDAKEKGLYIKVGYQFAL